MVRFPVFYDYILTNRNKTVLYTGMTNNLADRLIEHWIGKAGSFTTRYQVYYLIWYDTTRYVLNAIQTEKAIKRCSRKQKDALIGAFNKDWTFLNEEILGNWPPSPEQIADLLQRRAYNKAIK